MDPRTLEHLSHGEVLACYWEDNMQLVALVTVLICNSGGPGTAVQAQPVLDSFLRHLERTGGITPQKLVGFYATKLSACEALVARERPQLIVCDLPTYLQKRRAWHLSPIAHMGGAKAMRYSLLVRKGHGGGLGSLAKQLLVAPLARDGRFIAKIVLGGAVAADYFKLKTTRRPLRGLRKVARGQAAATIVDQKAMEFLPQLKLPVELVALKTSPDLPGLTLCGAGKKAEGRAVAKKIAKALPQLCQGPGAKLCKTFGVRTFVKADLKALKHLYRLYQR